jgi:2-keto-3-deoxy-L-fuconate dehydrogenase
MADKRNDHFAALEGLTAIVTGASSGIGQAVCRVLHDFGVIVGALNRTEKGVPAGAHWLQADVTNQELVTKAVDGFVASLPQGKRHLDILVNNAGVSFVGTVEDGTEEDWWRVFDINVFGQMRVMRACLPHLRESKAASVIVMSSCSALNGVPDRALYSASKGATQALAMAMASDLVKEGIRVNSLSPATVNTPFMEEIIRKSEDPEGRQRQFNERQATCRMIDPDELGLAVAYMAHPANHSLTGTTIEVDGGMKMLRTPRQFGA